MMEGITPAGQSRGGHSTLLAGVVRYVVLALLVWAVGLPVSLSGEVDALPGGRLEEVGGIRLAYLSGEPYQMGLQQGALLREPIRDLVRGYVLGHLVANEGAGHFWLLAQARFVATDYPEALRSELEGIADGAGLSYSDVLLLNTIPDLLTLAHRLPSAELVPELFSPAAPLQSSSSLCTAFAGWGGSTEGGRLLVGHSLESSEGRRLRDHLLVTIRQPNRGNASVSVGLVGSVGVWAGMNEASIAVALASSPSVDVAASGQPLPFLLRQVLDDCVDIESLTMKLMSTPRLYGGNIIAADGKAPQGIAIELSAHRQALFPAGVLAEDLARTNHFLSAELASSQEMVLGARDRQASESRLSRVEDWLSRNRGWIGVDKALALLVDIGVGAAEAERGGGTLQSALFVPADAALWIAPGLGADTGSFVRLVFPELSAAGSGLP
jgi:hypothetical protein